jgi:hypothetical protein
MLAAVLTLALAADPFIMVGKFEMQGGDAALASALRSVIEDDLARVSGAVRLDAERDATNPGARLRGPNILVAGKLIQLGGSGRVTVVVTDIRSSLVKGTASMKVEDGRWGADRTKLISEICKAAGVLPKGGVTTREYSTEQLLAWGKALAAGTPEAIAEVAKKWPDFGPAQRRAAK